MVLVDTNVIVGLLDPRDQSNALALADLNRFKGRERLGTTVSVLCEVTSLLPHLVFRTRLKNLLNRTPVQVLPAVCAWDHILDWMLEYAEHRPDWADAELIMLTSIMSHVRVWSYDKEFWTIWRRPNGSTVPMAIPRRG